MTNSCGIIGRVQMPYEAASSISFPLPVGSLPDNIRRGSVRLASNMVSAPRVFGWFPYYPPTSCRSIHWQADVLAMEKLNVTCSEPQWGRSTMAGTDYCYC